MAAVSTVDPEKVFAAYRQRLERRKKSESHLREYRLTTQAFMEFLQENDLRMEDVRRPDIEDFFAATGWSPNTQKARVTCLRRPWAYAVEQEMLDRSPFNGMEIELEKPRITEPEIISNRELRQIKEGISDLSDWVLFHFLAYTGMRIMEIRQCLWTDVSFAEQTIYVRGKGSRDRTIPLHPALQEALTSVPMFGGAFDRASAYIFPGQRGPTLTHGGAWAKVKKMARGHDVSPHDFRRTFATSMHDNHADDAATRQILGHSKAGDTHLTHYRLISQKVLYREILKVYADDPL